LTWSGPVIPLGALDIKVAAPDQIFSKLLLNDDVSLTTLAAKLFSDQVIVADDDCCNAQRLKASPCDEPKKRPPDGVEKLDKKADRSGKRTVPKTATSTVGIEVRLNRGELDGGGEEGDEMTNLAASVAMFVLGND